MSETGATEWQPRISEVIGRFARASNATLLARCEDTTLVVYKPVAGERPLWDFPEETLAAREALTYDVSEALGLGVVPETVIGDGPFGTGAIQRFIDVDEDFDPLPLVEEADPSLWPIAFLDLICNNADRKVGHVIREEGTGRLFGIDHGLTFHPEEKLRTVLWGYSGQPLPPELGKALARLRDVLDDALGTRVNLLLGPVAANALVDRVEALVRAPVHPEPPVDRPAVPWPPF